MTSFQTVKMRPKIDIPLAKADWLIEFLALAVLVLLIGMAVSAWTQLPDTIPTHFNWKGEIDGYGSKTTVLLLPLVAMGMYTLLSILTQFPRSYNYIVEITEENAATQYKLAKTLMRVLKLEVLLTFSYLEFSIIHSALNHRIEGAMVLFLPVSLAVIFGTLGYYLYRSKKA